VPKRHVMVAEEGKLEPVIVTREEPAMEPEAGVISEMVGVGSYM